MYTPPPVAAALIELMAEIGPKWASNTAGHVKMMVEAYSEVLRSASGAAEGMQEMRDVAYGNADARQVLDVYRPSGATHAPMALFLHGGAFTDGEKDRTPEIHANICRYFARHGVVGINVEYRQAPKWTWPAGAEDVALAVRWARENAARIGGDAARVFIIGSSAGAAHTAAYAYDGRMQPAGGHGIAGHIVISGRVRADNRPDNPNARKVEAYYGSDASRFEDLSPVSHAGAHSPPTMIAIAEYENPLIDVYCAELFFRLAQANGRASRFIRLAGHNHASIHAHIGTAEDRLGRELLEFIRLGR
jgi:acetyl esterase